MIEGENYDAVFAKIADEILADQSIEEQRRAYNSRAYRTVISPLRHQGVPDEMWQALERRSKEIYQQRKILRDQRRTERMNRSFAPRTSENDKRQRGDGPMRRYADNNIVPRANGRTGETK